jgi:uncharacterized protein YbjT (DUF2867 family)
MNILLIGWSGVTGRFVLEKLIDAEACKEVILWGRKKPDVISEKLFVYDGKPEELVPKLEKVDAVICCLGTTMKTAGSKQNFLAVDFDLPLLFAQMAKNAGVKKFALMSAVGAKTNTTNFYLKTKGELEKEIIALGFSRTDIFRPSLLLGPRKEKRIGESIAKVIAPLFNPFMIGSLSIYKSIKSETVAQAMVNAVMLQNKSGVFIHHYNDMRK